MVHSLVLCLVFASLEGIFAGTPALPACCEVDNSTGVQFLNYVSCDVPSPSPSFKLWPNHKVKYQPILCLDYFTRDKRDFHIDDAGILHWHVEDEPHSCLKGRLPDELYAMEQYCLDYDLERNVLVAHICIDDEQAGKYSTPPAPLPQKICTAVSAVLLLITGIVYWNKSSPRWSNAAYVVNQSAALGLAFGFLVGIQFYPHISDCFGCLVTGYCLQYFFLASFFWMNAHSVDLYLQISRCQPRDGSLVLDEMRRKKFIRALLYSWGVPFFIGLTTFVLQKFDLIPDPQFTPDIGRNACFFIFWKVKWIYFYGPMTVIITMNCVLFSLTFYVLFKHHQLSSTLRQANRTKLEKEIWFCLQYLRLFLVTGLTWAGEMIGNSFRTPNDSSSLHYLWLAIDLFNSLQGVFMFLIFVYDRKYLRKYCSFNDNQSWSTLVTGSTFVTSSRIVSSTVKFDNHQKEVTLSV